MRKRNWMLILIALLSLSMILPATAQEATEEAAKCEEGFRLVTHLMGASCIPEAPQRAVIIDYSATELELVAGRMPIAYSELILGALLRMNPELETSFDAVREAGVDYGFPPNLEVIVSANPDLLVISSDLINASIYDELAATIPTIVFEPTPGNGRHRMEFFGDLLGINDTVNTLLSDYDARVAELRDLLSDTAGETTVSLVRTFPDQIGLLLEGTGATALLHEVGLARPESQSVDYDYVLSELGGRPELLISEEELTLADADIAFVFGDAPSLTSKAAWQALSVAQAGHVYEVSYAWWGDSLLAAHAMLDDLFEYVAGAESTVPNPFADGIPTVTAEATETP